MTHEEARRRLERTTEFSFRGDLVLVRDPRWLRSIDALRSEDRTAEARRASPVAHVLAERAA
jgi:hypothetical protein